MAAGIGGSGSSGRGLFLPSMPWLWNVAVARACPRSRSWCEFGRWQNRWNLDKFTPHAPQRYSTNTRHATDDAARSCQSGGVHHVAFGVGSGERARIRCNEVGCPKMSAGYCMLGSATPCPIFMAMCCPIGRFSLNNDNGSHTILSHTSRRTVRSMP